MNNWFTVKVKYTKQLENGQFKRVSEPYLLAALTFTDAEARIYEELGNVIRGEFNVVGIARTEIHDIFAFDDADYWYKVKITYEAPTEDEEKGRKVSQNFLVAAHSVKDAYERIKESLSGLMVDYQIPSITLSPIVDIFPYYEESESRNSSPSIEKEVVHTPSGKGQVFSASGSDIDDEEDAFDEEIDASELEDEYTDEE
jgi:hypothetical protein